MDSVAAEMVRLRVTDWVCTGLLESVTLNVNDVALAVAVGAPLMVPVPSQRETSWKCAGGQRPRIGSRPAGG